MCKTVLQVEDLQTLYRLRQTASPLIKMHVKKNRTVNEPYHQGLIVHFISQGTGAIDFVCFSVFVDADKVSKSGVRDVIEAVNTYYTSEVKGTVINGYLTGLDLLTASDAFDITKAINQFFNKGESEVSNG